ncbi:MAG TPA: hypothetical protein VF658_18805 [Pyrinomonadaceae bacterium]|jgi:hypothetical protein
MFKEILRLKLFVLAITVLLCATATIGSAQHEKHDMGNMPGAKKQQSKPKPQAKRSPKKKQPAPHVHTPGMDMSKPSEPTASPDASESPEAKPETSPAQEDTNAPDAQQPEPATPTTPAVEKTQTPVATPATDANQPPETQNNPGGAGSTSDSGGGQKPATDSHDQMPGMKHDQMPGMNASGATGASATDQIPTTDSLDLMVMSEREMSIRVGTSTSNTLNMSQMGSGTAWQPGTTPMSMYFKYAQGWLFFLHGEAKLGVNSQGGPRGVTKFESQNWIMPMAFRRVGGGTLALRGMFSLEPFTFSPGGSPQLFQTGESYKGRRLVDKQHPHDLFMELSATYTIPLGERATWFAYAGFPGEPALGPTAFMHRWSASENPSAPLAHHLQDSTHISFGVFTTGFTYRWFKLEASVFNGREPDENRYDFEFNPWNSRSARLSFAPNNNWSMQISHGFLKNPEPLEPGDIRRTTASISYNKNLKRGNWASSLIWGRNHGQHGGDIFNVNSYTAESTLNFLDLNYVYTRLELVDKNELLEHEELDRLGLAGHPSFRIGAYTFGAAREIWNTEKLSMAVGGDFTFYSKPPVLDELYGSNPTSYKFFIRLRPGKMTMSGHGGMHRMAGDAGKP